MATDGMRDRLRGVERDLGVIKTSAKFRQLSQNGAINSAFMEADRIARKWLDRVKPFEESMEDSSLQCLAVYAEQIIAIIEGRVNGTSTNVASSLQQRTNEFRSKLNEITLDLLDAAGVLDAPERLSEVKASALSEIKYERMLAKEELEKLKDESTEKIRTDAKQALEEYELAKEKSNKIVVDQAEKQFVDASKKLRGSAHFWLYVTISILACLMLALFCFFYSPPEIIRHIEQAIEPGSKSAPIQVSVPLLVIAGAYFTAIRLALIGVLGVALAVSLRMMRAYYHMAEHNEHRLRVTKSISAFVAAIRTPEQKDLGLGKLVESVTDFGDSGMLSGQGESSTWPSIMLESITKNVGKSE